MGTVFIDPEMSQKTVSIVSIIIPAKALSFQENEELHPSSELTEPLQGG